MTDKSDKDIKRLKTIVAKVDEETKILLDKMIKDFMEQPDLKEVTFPNLLSNIDRAYVHYQASRNGLLSSSTGVGTSRRLTLRRATERETIDEKSVKLTRDSLIGVGNLRQVYPFKVLVFDDPMYLDESRFPERCQTSRLCLGPSPRVPKPPRPSNKIYLSRSCLPIWKYQKEILDQIEKHRVLFIRGSTGCGKTTQVGQFILDDAYARSKKVRVICTVPRRIAAISVSERVASERGERVGHTVGYQIRLESRLSPVETLLTYCTSGVLLRSLTGGSYGVLENTTHIIIDEIHERDRQTDFLLACLRDILGMFPDLHLILMGANLDDELFSNFFKGDFESPIINVEGKMYPVRVFHLEDILQILNYENLDMKYSKRGRNQDAAYSRLLQKLTAVHVKDSAHGGNYAEETEVEDQPNEVVDKMIEQFWTTGEEFVPDQFVEMLKSGLISANYRHSVTGVTMLMAAAVRGDLVFAENLLQLGADLNVKCKIGDYNFSAVDWASDHRQHEVLKMLLEYQYQYKTKMLSSGNDSSIESQDREKFQRLDSYLRSINEERVDLMLILRIIGRIHHTCDTSHAILIFLPGYDEIVSLKHLILHDRRLTVGTFTVFMLHSNIQTGDQRAAFEKPPRGMRKIVLSTNIAESSLTIEDIVYVVDSGKAKEKSFDSMTCVTQLKSVWISKASADQRRGRAGRCREGVCYRLYSKARYESMAEFPIPEIVRTSLQELCLQARSFIRPEMKIERFFTRIPEPPAPIAIQKSVELLETMGALDEDERLTRLGHHLLEFPLEPFLGKALIYAVVLKCLDPILTLVSIISYRDPFQLPSDPRDKQKAQECKAQFARRSFSDHMAYLKAFQDWEKSKMFSDDVERKFCRDNYLSPITFEMIYDVRSQLLGQLRAGGFVQTKGKSDLSELNKNSNNWALVKGVLVTTLYPNICGVNRERKVLFNSFNSKVFFHPSTTLTKKKDGVHDLPKDCEWIIFDEMTQQGTSNLVKGCTCVSTAAIALFAGSFKTTPTLEDSNEALIISGAGGQTSVRFMPSSLLKINQWITLRGSKETIDSVVFMRQKILDLVLKRLNMPRSSLSPEDDAVIQTVAAILETEDFHLGFETKENIGQWPKLVSGNLMCAPMSGFEKELPTDCGEDGVRYFVVEVSDFAQAHDIMESKVWMVPEVISSKFTINNNSEKTEGGLAIVFFWVPTANHFTGSIYIRDTSTIDFLSEVPIGIVKLKIVDCLSAEREIGFKTAMELPMHGLELDPELGGSLLKMFC